MSRRRKPPNVPPGTPQATITVVCTGRGRHPEAVLHSLADGRVFGTGDSVFWPSPVAKGVPVIPWSAFAGKPQVFRFACSRCGRDTRLREPNVLAAVDAAREAKAACSSRPVLDISLIC